MLFKKCQVVMLPTNEKAHTDLIFRENRLMLQDKKSFKNDRKSTQTKHFHLYFLSDDEIKEGDYGITQDANGNISVLQYTKEIHISRFIADKKIIATTDSSLEIIKYEIGDEPDVYGFPQPSQQFIEKYIESYNKGEIITDVLVEYEQGKSYSGNEGLIVKEWLKINPKDNTITIKKIKDSWNREEVADLIRKSYYEATGQSTGHPDGFCSKFIEQNL